MSEESNRHTDADMDLPAPVVESDGEGVASSLPSAPSERDSDSDMSLPEPNGFDDFMRATLTWIRQAQVQQVVQATRGLPQ